MNRLLLIILISLVHISSGAPAITTSGKSCDVAQVYEVVELESGSKVIDSYGNVKEAKTLLVPTKLKEGKYSVELTKVDSDFYKIYGTELYEVDKQVALVSEETENTAVLNDQILDSDDKSES